ncbi:hypothetical protein, partial [Klebsiella pneumoniae]|uniref:hypothetical protein n=1 Tax=Klebsiella pneumoniae TaxID=573 RepID=UPI001952C69B
LRARKAALIQSSAERVFRVGIPIPYAGVLTRASVNVYIRHRMVDWIEGRIMSKCAAAAAIVSPVTLHILAGRP